MKKITIIPDRPCPLTGYFEKKFLIGIVLLGVLCGCQPDVSCQEVLNAKCVECHSASTSCSKIGQSEEWWLRTIDAMEKLGADLSKQERKVLAACLSNPAGTKVEKFCK